MKNIILCCGENGRGVVFGKVEADPVPGEPVKLHNARMIIYWANKRGLFDVCVNGPDTGSNITPAVDEVVETVWQEFLTVSDKAAEKINSFDS